MMTGGGFGNLFSGPTSTDWVGPYGWRYVFFFGIAPAILLAFIRRGMVEPERFTAVKARRQALAASRDHTEDDREFLRLVPAQLFSRKIRFQTLGRRVVRARHLAGGVDGAGLAADDSEPVARKSRGSRAPRPFPMSASA